MGSLIDFLSTSRIFLLALNLLSTIYGYQVYGADTNIPSTNHERIVSFARHQEEPVGSLNGKIEPKTFFLRENNTEIVAQIGATVVFHCAAQNVGKNTVSWVRRKDEGDYHLLTVDTVVYSSDQRFQVRFIVNEHDWQLHVRYVQLRDAGSYECQVSSHPPMSLITKLNVVEATSEILGGPEKFLRSGSSLRLVCILKQNTQPPSYVFWYLNRRMINYDEKVKVETSGELSVIFLSDLRPESSGNYSCVPSNAKSSTIHIQVLRGGDMPAAIHSNSPSTRNFLRFEAFILAIFLSTSSLSCSSSVFHFLFLHIFIVESLPFLSQPTLFGIIAAISSVLFDLWSSSLCEEGETNTQSLNRNYRLLQTHNSFMGERTTFTLVS